jgi:protein-L-isoaspartate(D-aspartate) O-methyltransferase
MADSFARDRLRMVADQIEARGITDPKVLSAMRAVPRHLFVPEEVRAHAYDDSPLPIGLDQTISQPYIVALMTSLARPSAGKSVLEIGTGSGYQAAVLVACGATVYSIEIVAELGRRAAELLRKLGYHAHVRIGDGFDGWPEAAPFDSIVCTAAPEKVPQPLLAQLGDGGRLVIPVGAESQDLVVITRSGSTYTRETVAPVRFVPMTGKARE